MKRKQESKEETENNETFSDCYGLLRCLQC